MNSSCCERNTNLVTCNLAPIRNQRKNKWIMNPSGISDEVIQEIVEICINEDKEIYEFYNSHKTHVLFVFHVPENMIDSQLYQLFVRYGALKATVMTRKCGRGRGFGFVHFASRYQAQTAITAMDGYEIGYKRLRVTFKTDNEMKAMNAKVSESK